MKKILFIIQSYPSERSANVLCDAKIMKELLKTGEYEIHALTYQYAWQKREDIIDGFHIHRFRKSVFWGIYTWSQHHEDQKISRLIYLLHRLALRLKQIVTIPIYPCYEPINSLLYARAARKLNKKHHFDLVFAEHHGFDTLYAGHALKKSTGSEIKFLATLWDPFIREETAKYLPKEYARRRIEKAEERILSNADRVIAMHSNEEYHKQHAGSKPYCHEFVFLDIPGIIKQPEEKAEDEYTKSGMINLLYAGWLNYPDRDPSFMIDCINRITWPKPVHLIFLSAGNGVEVVKEKEKSFNGHMTIHGYVGHDEMVKICNNADGFLNIGSHNPGMVPSKLFEYMSYGKPILSTYTDETDASKEYLEKYPLGTCLNQNADSAKNDELLNDFIRRKIGNRVPFEQVSGLFPNNTPGSYIQIIEELLSRSSSGND